jgi:hypothetical protein
VHVHAPWPQQRRVEAILVVGGEDDDALLAAGRPQPVDEVEQPGQGYVLLLQSMSIACLNSETDRKLGR